MIQPLQSPRTTWVVSWIDLEEPIPCGEDYFLPTLLLVCDAGGVPVAAPEILEELDQGQVENILLKHFEQLGTPHRLTIVASPEWDFTAWKMFSTHQKVEVRFQKAEHSQSDSIHALVQTVSLRFSQGEALAVHEKNVAQGLINTAMRMRSMQKRLALLRAALLRDADCSFAQVELADLEFQQGNWKVCLETYAEVIAREEVYWEEKQPVWWADIATRPYLRALYGRALTLWHRSHYADAAVQLEQLLHMNPTDNQGVRFLIPLLHLLAENREAASAYFEWYETTYPDDDYEPAFLYGWGLCLTLTDHEAEGRAKYHKAIFKNLHMASLLLEAPLSSRPMWHPDDQAEPEYAKGFLDSYAALWDREPSALRILREVWHDLEPRIRQLIALRERMADFQDHHYEPNFRQRWRELLAEDERLREEET